MILLGLLASSAALAADDDTNIPQENVYASQLCHIVSGETQVGTADSYVQKKDEKLHGDEQILQRDEPAAVRRGCSE
nr:hypothetical protein [Candidatus Pantoea persica]